GNTLVCSGVNGTVFEVTPKNEVVWQYVNPARGEPMGPPGLPAGVAPPGLRPPQPGEVLPAFLHDVLGLTAEQKKSLREFQKDAGAGRDKLLTKEKKKQRGTVQGRGGPPRAGQILTPFQQARLKLTADQKKELAKLQKEADGTLDKTLDEKQKKQLKQMATAF